MLKRVWRQLPNPRSSVFHTPALPSLSDNVPCSPARVDLSSPRLPSKWTCTSRLANLGCQKSARSCISISRMPNRLAAQILHMAGLPETNKLPPPQSISFDTRPKSNLKSGGYIFLTSAPHKTSHGSSLLVSPIPLLNRICSSQPYSTLTCPLLLSRDQIRCKDRLLEAEKSQLFLTSLPFSSAPSKEEKPISTWGKLKQMVKDYW